MDANAWESPHKFHGHRNQEWIHTVEKLSVTMWETVALFSPFIQVQHLTLERNVSTAVKPSLPQVSVTFMEQLTLDRSLVRVSTVQKLSAVAAAVKVMKEIQPEDKP